MSRVIVKLRSVLLLLFISLILFAFFKAYDFMAIDRPSKPEILVVEGWLPESALDQAKEVFLNQGYKKLITTGFPYNQGFMMGSGGKMEFDVRSLETSSDSIYEITIQIRGTKAKGEYAHIRVYSDSLELAETFTTGKKRDYHFKVKLGSPPCIIMVEFDNDDYTRCNDRNLFFYSITVNGQLFPADNENVSYYGKSNGIYFLRQFLTDNSALNAANYLIKEGIADTLITAVVSVAKIKSRTYTSALDLKKWLSENGFSDHPSLTILTQGLHSRRSYISFRKAFGSTAEIGIKALPDPEITRSNWWKRYKGWRKLIYEAVGVIYISIIFFP